MLAPFLNLWIFARLVQSATATALCLGGGILGWRLVRRWQPGQSSEQQLVLERQAELVASVMQVALILEVLGLGLAVLVADRLTGSIRGAMCAFGVLASTRAGFGGLLVSVLTALGCGLWVVFHRLDLRLETPVLTRRKFVWLPVVAILALADLAFVVSFVRQLDFKVIASCCSVWVDAAVVNNSPMMQVLAPLPAGLVGLASVSIAAMYAAGVARMPTSRLARTTAVAAILAPLLSLPAILGVVAPHALGTPMHFCPFCLFHRQGGGLGWPLFGGLLTGSLAGMSLGLVELNRARAANEEVVRDFEKTLGRWSALGWCCALVSGVFPVVRYWLLSGGVSVFGRM